MFGKNKIYNTADFQNKDTLSIVDIFYTIQGEGTFSGNPAIFIRLGYCSIRCYFCDTDFESNVTELSIDNILEKVSTLRNNNPCNLIVITGGEPLLQYKLKDLIEALLNKKFIVQIETSGSVYIDLPFEHDDLYIICSPKTGKINKKLIPHIFAYKYIIKEKNYSDDDGLPIYSTQIENKLQMLARPTNNALVYISPMDEYNEEQNKRNIQAVKNICLKHGYLVSLQIHKILGVE